MKILALEHDLPGAAPAAFKRWARAEARQIWDLQQTGLIREAYYRADRPAAVLVLECASVDEAGALLDRLPFVREKLIAFEFIPIRAYPGFSRLFKTELDLPGED